MKKQIGLTATLFMFAFLAWIGCGKDEPTKPVPPPPPLTCEDVVRSKGISGERVRNFCDEKQTGDCMKFATGRGERVREASRVCADGMTVACLRRGLNNGYNLMGAAEDCRREIRLQQERDRHEQRRRERERAAEEERHHHQERQQQGFPRYRSKY